VALPAVAEAGIDSCGSLSPARGAYCHRTREGNGDSEKLVSFSLVFGCHRLRLFGIHKRNTKISGMRLSGTKIVQNFHVFSRRVQNEITLIRRPN
jgi:hypothetical protein